MFNEYFNRLAQRLTHDTEGERSDKRLRTRNRPIKMVNTTYQWQLDRKKILAMDGTDTTAPNTSASTLFRKLVDTCLWNKLRCRLKWEDKKRRGEGGKKKGTNSSATCSKKFETSSNFARFTRSTREHRVLYSLEITFQQFSQPGYQKTNCVYCTRFSKKRIRD